MSHTSIYKTALGNVSKQLLQQAIRNLAKQIGARVVTSIQDFYGEATKVDIALKTDAFSRGIGFNVDRQGKLTVVGDSYMMETEFNRVSGLATNFVKAYKVAQNARTAHPTATLQVKARQKEVLLEVIM